MVAKDSASTIVHRLGPAETNRVSSNLVDFDVVRLGWWEEWIFRNHWLLRLKRKRKTEVVLGVDLEGVFDALLETGDSMTGVSELLIASDSSLSTDASVLDDVVADCASTIVESWLPDEFDRILSLLAELKWAFRRIRAADDVDWNDDIVFSIIIGKSTLVSAAVSKSLDISDNKLGVIAVFGDHGSLLDVLASFLAPFDIWKRLGLEPDAK